MSQLQRVFRTLGGFALLFGLPVVVHGQVSTNQFAPQGIEYAPAGAVLGDQIYPSLAVKTNGGFLVWQDNVTDGDGQGISATILNSTFSPLYGNFRINQNGTGDQENPRVAILSGGGAAFVWQGGTEGYQHIYARFLSSNYLWNTGDVMVNSSTNNYQANPAIATLANGNVVIIYSSFGQDNNDGLQGVFGQVFTPAGTKVGNEFQVNQFTPYNQRSSAVAAFPNGNFIVTWISELQNSSATVDSTGTVLAGYNSVDAYARVFNSSGVGQTGEFQVNTSTNRCSAPSVAVASDNAYTIVWAQMDGANANNGWDIFSRSYSSAGIGGLVQYVNSQLYGDQVNPQITSLGTDYMVVWTSYGQDGSHEGVYGQFMHEDGSFSGSEQLVNTTKINAQKYPCVTSDGGGRFLVAWTSFMGLTTGMDIEAQAYSKVAQPLVAPSAPMVTALSSFLLSATWPAITGYSISNYNLTVDGVVTNLTNAYWCNKPNNYNPATVHTFQLTYTLKDGRVSPASAIVNGATWGYDDNSDGLPDDWEATYYGTNQSNWPLSGNTLLAPGFSVKMALWEGVDPTKPATWLKQTITSTPQGLFLSWNTVPGGVYQVMSSTNLKTWTNLGAPRFAPGSSDSIYLGLSNMAYYKISRIFF